MKQNANGGGLLKGTYLYMVVNKTDHLAGLFADYRYYVRPTRCGRAVNTPNTSSSSNPDGTTVICPPGPPTGPAPGWHQEVTHYTVTHGQIVEYYRFIHPDAFPVVKIPQSVAKGYTGTVNHQNTLIANYLHKYNAYLHVPLHGHGIVKFSNFTEAEYKVVNANTQQYALVHKSGRVANGYVILDNGKHVAPDSGPYGGEPIHFPATYPVNMGSTIEGLGTGEAEEGFVNNFCASTGRCIQVPTIGYPPY